ncbi:MAG: helix-hairpin-helix domain-containing protein [Pseudomonadota bacterium]
MGRLTDDMTNLRDEIEFLQHSRGSILSDVRYGIAELQANVADMQEGFRNERVEMAGKMKDNTHAFMAGLYEYVSDQKKDAADMKAGFLDDRTEMAAKLREDLDTFMAGLSESVSDMKKDAVDMMKGFRNAHADTAAKLRDDLETFLWGVRSHVSDMKKQFQSRHADRVGKSKAERKAFLSEVRQSVDGLKEEVAGLLKTFSKDRAGARGAWLGSSHAGKKATRRTVDLQPKGRAEEDKTVEEIFPDDLTRIKGIGPGRENTLNESGIMTFARLAASTPEELKRVFGGSSRMLDFEGWIDQAGKLVG